MPLGYQYKRMKWGFKNWSDFILKNKTKQNETYHKQAASERLCVPAALSEPPQTHRMKVTALGSNTI